MLRAIVVFLLLANAAFFVWTQNWLTAIGLPAEVEVESNTTPVALLRPDSLHLLSAQQLEAEQQLQEQKQAKASQPSLAQAALAAAQPQPPEAEPTTDSSEPDSSPELAVAPVVAPVVVPVVVPVAAPVCKAVASLTDEQMTAIRPLLTSLPNHSWRVDESVSPGRWMVFLGGFDDDLVLAAKRAQLEAKRLDFAPVRNTPQGTGFSLGRFSSENAAKQESARLERSGINGLRVVQERVDTPIFALQFSDYANLSQSIRTRLMPLLQGKPLRDCV